MKVYSVPKKIIKVKCPRCQAEGKVVEIIVTDGYGLCPRCDTAWQRLALGQMVALD